MAKRLLTVADRELREEVMSLLTPERQLPSMTQLERWRQAGLIPATERHGLGRGCGTSSRYPAGTAGQVVALMRQLEHDPRLLKAALPLFLARYPVRGDVLRRAYLGEIAGLRATLERQAVRWQAGIGKQDAESMASALAFALTHRRMTQDVRQRRQLMLSRLRNAHEWMPVDDTPQALLEGVFTVLFYAFLSGRLMACSEDVLYQAYVAFGYEEFATTTLALMGVRWRASYDALAAALPVLSLPSLTRAVMRMDETSFARARDDFQSFIDLLSFLAEAVSWLLRVDLARIFALPRRKPSGIGLALVLPAMPALGHVVGRERLHEYVRIAQEELPQWREAWALLSTPEGRAADQDELRAVVLASVRSAVLQANMS
jgi:hypothetical protein